MSYMVKYFSATPTIPLLSFPADILTLFYMMMLPNSVSVALVLFV